MNTPNVADVVARLHELVHAITQGRESLLREFTMRVPAEPNRDADLVLSAAAHLLEREHKARTEAERERDDLLATIFRDGGQEAARLGKDAVPTAIKRAAEVIGELAALRNRPCPYVHSSGEGTHYCTLPHAAEKELAELRKRVAEAPRGMVRGFMLEPETQPGWLDKMGGKHVAIVPLREGE